MSSVQPTLPRGREGGVADLVILVYHRLSAHKRKGDRSHLVDHLKGARLNHLPGTCTRPSHLWLRHWITFYNHHRPHTAHGGQSPAVVYFNSIETDQQVQAVA